MVIEMKEHFADVIVEKLSLNSDSLREQFIDSAKEVGVRYGAVEWADSKVRQAVRVFSPGGLGKKDVYQGPGK